MIVVKNLNKVYNNGAKAVHVLKGLDLTVEKGKFIALTGPSGAGKSTLLHILGGLDIPSSGNVFFDGQDLNKLDDSELCKIRNEKIGFVFQFYHLLPEFTVLENVIMPSIIMPKAQNQRHKDKDRALKLLKEIGLDERIAHFPGQLSGGEKQRVAIARALINKPAVLFCDEPTGNLDSKTGNEVIDLLKKINLENKTTVVLVTHNVELARSADRIYHLNDGVLVH